MVEFRAEDVADLAHAGKVLRAAVDVDDLLEEREPFVVMRVDITDDSFLGSAQSIDLRLRDRGDRQNSNGQYRNLESTHPRKCTSASTLGHEVLRDPRAFVGGHAWRGFFQHVRERLN